MADLSASLVTLSTKGPATLATNNTIEDDTPAVLTESHQSTMADSSSSLATVSTNRPVTLATINTIEDDTPATLSTNNTIEDDTVEDLACPDFDIYVLDED